VSGWSSPVGAEAPLTRGRGASGTNGCVSALILVATPEQSASVRGIICGVWHDSRRSGLRAACLLTQGAPAQSWPVRSTSALGRAVRFGDSCGAWAGTSCRAAGTASMVSHRRQRTSAVGRNGKGSSSRELPRARLGAARRGGSAVVLTRNTVSNRAPGRWETRPSGNEAAFGLSGNRSVGKRNGQRYLTTRRRRLHQSWC
jgi:hypothetical protein